MYCEKCGKEIRDDALFCGHCGAKVGEVGIINNSPNLNVIDNTSQSTAKGNSASRIPIVVVAIVAGFLFIIGVSLLLYYVNGGNTGRKNGFEESSDSSYNSNSYSSNSYNSGSSNVTTNKSTNSSAYNRNSTSSQKDIKKAIVGKWQISSFAYPDEFSTRDGKIINYIGSNPNSKYQYMVMYAMLDFREDGKIYSFSGFDIFKYEIRDNDTIVAVDIANNGSGLGGAVVTFKYDRNNKTLTVENFTNNEGKVITDNGAGSGYDRSKAIGNVYRKLS